MKHISFSKIPQFRDVIRNIKHQTYFTGLDDSGEPIYDETKILPKVSFKGTVKIHGSNGGICFSKDEFWCQSRKMILSIEKDNNGFHSFCHSRKDQFNDIRLKILNNRETSLGSDDIISIFGEYCGVGINKGCAIHQLSKRFIIFAVKVVPTIGDSFYIDSNLHNTDYEIYNINDFKTFNIEIDFNRPELAQNKIVELVNQVENECPVGKAFGVKGIGEGIVWVGEYEGTRHIFKTKGEKHAISSSKVKTIAPIDVEKVNNVREFVEYAVTENRMLQALQEVFEGKELVIQKMGDFLKWIVGDIKDEEEDVMIENGLVIKDVSRAISSKARPWFMEKLN